MTRLRDPLFLARDSYRRRRLMDAARVLPFAGAFVFLLPVLWASGVGTVAGIAYLFGSWIVLILAAGGVSRSLQAADESAGEETEAGETETP